MSQTQVAVNAAAIRNLADRLERMGYTGDAHAEAEAIALNLLADGYRRIEPIPPRGTGGSDTARAAALQATADAVAAAKARHTPPTPGASDEQLRLIAIRFGEHGVTDRTKRLQVLGELVGRPIGSSRELTRAEATLVLDRFDHPPADEPPAVLPGDPDYVDAEIVEAELVLAPDERRETCTCGPGVWGTCDQCGAEAWVKHHCPFPCDDVTCENGALCIGCLTGHPCPMHNGPDWDDEHDAVMDDLDFDAGDRDDEDDDLPPHPEQFDATGGFEDEYRTDQQTWADSDAEPLVYAGNPTDPPF